MQPLESTAAAQPATNGSAAAPAGAQALGSGPAAPVLTEIQGGLSGEPPFDPREFLRVLQAMRNGDFTVRLPGDQLGLIGKIADTFNEIVAANQRMASELERVGRMVGREGNTRHRVKIGNSMGAWSAMESS